MRLLVSAQPGELRAAWIDGGRLADLLVQRDDHPSLLGDLWLGRVTALDRGLGAAFVELGLARPGLLPLAEAPGRKLAEGAAVVVRVLRDPAPDKGPRLSARLIDPPPDLEARAAAAKPPARLLPGGDLSARLLAAATPPDEILVDDPETLREMKTRFANAGRPDLADLLKLDLGPEPLFERPLLDESPVGGSVEAAIESLLDPCVPLPGGGRLWIEPTHGLVAVDVDSGRHAAGDPLAAARAVDLEAAAEIPRQLRLRGLSGQIVIDFLELPSADDRRRVTAALRAGLKADPEPGRVQAMARSGLLVMTRRRGRPALHEILTAPCGEAGSGRSKTAATLAFEALRAMRRAAAADPGKPLVLEARPDLLAALDGSAKAARMSLESRLGQPLETLARPELGERGYEVISERFQPSRAETLPGNKS